MIRGQFLRQAMVHVRATDYRDEVHFEEVSLGYQKDWQQEKGVQNYLREILPGP